MGAASASEPWISLCTLQSRTGDSSDSGRGWIFRACCVLRPARVGRDRFVQMLMLILFIFLTCMYMFKLCDTGFETVVQQKRIWIGSRRGTRRAC